MSETGILPALFAASFEYDYRGRRVEKVYEMYNGSAWREQSRLRFVYDGWTLDTPLRASPGDPKGIGVVGPTAASQGWNVVEVLDGSASNVILRKYTWGLDLSGLSSVAPASSPAEGIHSAGGIGGLLAVEDP